MTVLLPSRYPRSPSQDPGLSTLPVMPDSDPASLSYPQRTTHHEKPFSQEGGCTLKNGRETTGWI